MRASIKAIQAFEAAARLGSFALAAEELAVTPSAVSHQIHLLEEQLGALLFQRIHRSVLLTDVGRRYAASIVPAFEKVREATQLAASAGRPTTLAVHSTPSFATQWLLRRLPAYTEANPGIDLRVQASAERVDLAKGQVDVEIRYNPGPAPAGSVMIGFPDDVIVPMCSPRLAEGLRPIRRPADLAGHTLIHSEITILTWKDWGRQHRDVRLDLGRGPRFDRSFMAITAAVDGLGICLDSMLLAEQELASGRLVALFPETALTAPGHGFLTLRARAGAPNVVAFRSWLFAELERTRAWWEGQVAASRVAAAPRPA